ncbi:MAG TPA: ATP-binding protein [Chthoniobacterales bacterium]|nr:ATP-binding protein [Chthoniobacterales bacterium]
MEPNDDTEQLLRSSALQTASSIRHARQRAEQELLQAKRALELKTEELAHSLSMMRATLESTTDGILVTDGLGKITGFNEKFVEMWRVPREIVEARQAEALREAAGQQFQDPREFIARIHAIETSDLPESFDVLEFADGRVFERYSKVQRIDDRSVGRVWSFRDITERKRAEEKLRAAKIAAEKANQAKDDFLALLSHELRTPLTPALAAASYLAEHEELPPELREEVTAIRRNVQFEARLIDDLLDLTRITRGKLQLNPEAVDAHRLVQNALTIVHEDIVRKGLEVVTDLGASEHHVWADPIRIQQVFWNLLTNAVKFTPPGGKIAIRTSNGEGRFLFQITDTGVGIEPEHQARIFNAFEQGEVSVIRQFGGLGLGLTIAQTLLTLHGGTISVQSEGKDRGASFRVTLDVLPEPVAASVEAASGDFAITRSLRLLLVDDHADTRHILSRLLGKCGHEVSTADSGQNALKLMETEQFDALISDIGLPDTSGYELVREAKRRQPLQGIALSGFGMEEDVRRSLEAGFDYHLTKPVEFQDLKSLLQKIAS